jgi:hypothetical protein
MMGEVSSAHMIDTSVHKNLDVGGQLQAQVPIETF